MNILRQKESRLLSQTKQVESEQLRSIQAEIEELEWQIRRGMAQKILSVNQVIDEGMNIVAKLDLLTLCSCSSNMRLVE